MKNFKKVLALVLAVATLLSFATIASAVSSSSYKDAADITKNGQTEAIDVLSGIGVLTGYPDTTYKPNQDITRAEAAKIIAMFDNGATDISTLYASANPFVDAKGNWAESYIAYGYKAGIIAGVGKLLFAPNAKLTGVQFLKMVLVVLGYDAKTEGLEGTSWAVNTLALAKKIGLLDNLPATFDVAANLTRGDAATIMLNALNTDTVEYGQQYKFTPAQVQELANGEIVTVTNGVNYLTVAGAIDTGKKLAADWNLTNTTTYDVWGDPGHTWMQGINTIGEYMDTPVLTYTKAVTAHDLLIDLGVAATSGSTKTVDYIARNGALLGGTDVDSKTTKLTTDGSVYYVADAVLKHNTSYECIKTIKTSYTYSTTTKAYTAAVATPAPNTDILTIGGQGALTRVFKLNGKYAIVTIDTYLAKVTAVVPNTHLVPASLTMDVYDDTVFENTSNSYVQVTDYSGTYAKGDYALVNRLEGSTFTDAFANATDGARIHVVSIAKPAATGALNGWISKVSTTVGTTTYADACKFDMGYQGTRTNSYDVYVDAYGNIIGLADAAKTYTYGVIDSIYWAHSPAQKALAALVTVDGTKSADVTMTKILDGAGVTGDKTFAETNNENNVGAYADATLSANADKNATADAGYENHLYKFQATTAGTQIVAKGTHLANATIVNGYPTALPYATDGTVAAPGTMYYATNNNTTFLVETLDANSNPVYTSYIGMDKVPSMDKVSLCYFINTTTGYVDYVFVNATTADFTVSRSLAVIFDTSKNASAVDDNGRYGFYIWTPDADGKITTATLKYVSSTVALDTGKTDKSKIGYYAGLTDLENHGTGLYEVSCDANGFVVGLKYVGDESGVTGTGLKGTYKFLNIVNGVTGDTLEYITTNATTVYDRLAADVKYYAVNTVAVPSYNVTVGSASDATGKPAIAVYNAAGQVSALYYLNIGYVYKNVILTDTATATGTNTTLVVGSVTYTVPTNALTITKNGSTGATADLIAGSTASLLIPAATTSADTAVTAWKGAAVAKVG